MKRHSLASLFLLLIFGLSLLCFFGCGKANPPEPVPSVVPYVLSTSPASSETEVLINTGVLMIFSTSLDATSLSSSGFKLTAPTSGRVTGTVSYDVASRSVVFSPINNLAVSTTYTMTVETAIKSFTHTPMAAAKTWTFTTSATSDVVVPAIDTVSPSNGYLSAETNTILVAHFNKEMDPATITSLTFTLSSAESAVTGTVSYDAVAESAILVPGTQLINNTTYIASISKNATSVSGLKMAANYSWSFHIRP